jgi:hypothetical protein
MTPNVRQVVLLPAQLQYLARLASEGEGAIAVAQTGSVIHVNTGARIFDINAAGMPIPPDTQERLC